MLSRVINRSSQGRLSQITNHIDRSQTRTMAYANTKLKLNTGQEIPAVGFGTWQDKDAQEVCGPNGSYPKLVNRSKTE